MSKGNKKVNDIYLSDLRNYVFPKDMDTDHAWERYIRDKYEYKRFMSPSMKVSALECYMMIAWSRHDPVVDCIRKYGANSSRAKHV
jgi:hypothetical protein